MGAIENLANIFDWKSSENQSSHGITTPVNGVVDWSSFPSGFEHWITRGQTNLTIEATGAIISSNSTKTYFETYGDSQYGEFKNWIDGLGLKSYSASVPLESKFYLPFGNVKLEIHCDHNPSYIAQNSVFTNQFKHYLTDATMFTLQTSNFDFTSTNYSGVKVGFIATPSVFGFALICENIESKKIKAYIHEIELNDAFKTALGTDYTNGFTYEDDERFGDGGETSGFEGIENLYSDEIGIGPQPLSISSCGFMNVYKVDTNSLQNLGKDLFSDIDVNFDESIPVSEERYQEMLFQSKSILSTTNNLLNDVLSEDEINKEIVTNGLPTHGILYNIANLLKASFNNYFSSQLIKYIVDCHIVPVTPTVGNLENINIGYRQFNQQGRKCVGDFVTKSCGSIRINSTYKNFLDYSETRCKLYLPFVGIVDISPQYVFNNDLSIDYKFNIIDGSCLAFVSSTAITGSKSIIGTYSGSACMHLPITGENYSSALNGMLATVGGFASNPISGVSALLGNASAFSGSMLSSNGYGGSSSFMGIRTPYIIIEQPIPQLPPRYFKDHGALSLVVSRLSDCSGFTKCRDVIIPSSIPANIADRIKTKLETGVII